MARSTLPPLPGPRPVWRLLAVTAVALAAANCSSNPQKFAAGPTGNGIDPKYGVKASPRLYNEGDVIPKGGGRRFSGKPYVVAGRTYVPREDAKGYVREGLASWYGSAFHGRMTANGEVFDRNSIAAAHPTLPLPSYARVTNLKNGHSMVVRVNDRGPFHANRVMDVSEEVARALQFHNKGTERVRVEYVGKASVAGSDDRKLLASLRTDGGPAGTRSPVMLADLGPTEAPEAYAKPARAPLAFRPAPEAEEPGEAPAPSRLPSRAPIVMASAAVSVPAAVQPTAPRHAVFRPVAASAGLNPALTAPAHVGAAHARPAPVPAGMARGPASSRLAAVPPVKTAPMPEPRFAARTPPPALPVASKLALTKLAAEPAPKPGTRAPSAQALAPASAVKVVPKPAGAVAQAPAGRRGGQLAGIY